MAEIKDELLREIGKHLYIILAFLRDNPKTKDKKELFSASGLALDTEIILRELKWGRK